MAKKSRSIIFKNATLSKDGTITEYIKDDIRTYRISNLINEWADIDGLSISIKYDEDVASDEDGE